MVFVAVGSHESPALILHLLQLSLTSLTEPPLLLLAGFKGQEVSGVLMVRCVLHRPAASVWSGVFKLPRSFRGTCYLLVHWRRRLKLFIALALCSEVVVLSLCRIIIIIIHGHTSVVMLY